MQVQHFFTVIFYGRPPAIASHSVLPLYLDLLKLRGRLADRH